jgi:hypothetical protein
MSKEFIFWLVMLVALLMGLFGYWPASGAEGPRRGYSRCGFAVFVIIELCLLGWKTFGPAVR